MGDTSTSNAGPAAIPDTTSASAPRARTSLKPGTAGGATALSIATGGPATVSSIWWWPADGELVICEVKTRTSRRYGHPVEAVTATKQARIRRLALAYVAATGARGRLRFDIASVEQGEVEVWEAAF